VFPAGLSRCVEDVPEVVGGFVLELAAVPELPPHAARTIAKAAEAMTTERSRTRSSYREAPSGGGRDRARGSPGGSVCRVRRPAVLALASGLAAAGFVGLTATPAAAHICPVPVQIPVGTTATVGVGVTVEDATVPDVEIDIPAGLRLDRVDPKPGWTATRRGSVLRYRGGPIAAFTCSYFSIGVTAPARGAFGIPVVQRTADGGVVARTTPDPSNAGDRVLDQFVYAGIKPPSNTGSNGMPVAVIAGVVLVALGVVAAGVFAIRARRTRDDDDDDDEEEEEEEEGDDSGAPGADRDAELRARLEQFRRRAPDPPTRP
jgi:hypothetical protein